MIGDICLEHPMMAGIHFTGSNKTFNGIWKKISDNLEKYRSYPRIVGETGGKDFVFVHNSADVKEVVANLIRGAFEYQVKNALQQAGRIFQDLSGQKLGNYLYPNLSTIKVGSPVDQNCFVNAVIDRASFINIKGYIDRAKQSDKTEIVSEEHIMIQRDGLLIRQ